MTTENTKVLTARLPWGDELRLMVDLAQASAPIEYDARAPYEDAPRWEHTPYQTADARHHEDEAVELVLGYLGRDYYAAYEDEREGDDIMREVMAGTVITATYLDELEAAEEDDE